MATNIDTSMLVDSPNDSAMTKYLKAQYRAELAAQQQQNQAPANSGSSPVTSIISQLGSSALSSGGSSPGAGTGGFSLSSLFGGGGASSSPSMTGPYLYDAGSGLPVASSASGAPGLTSSGGSALSEGSGASLGGPAALAALGAGGAYGTYNNLKKENHGWKGAGQGAASGAALGTAILPGWGTVIGAGLGGLSGYFGDKGWNPLRMSTKEYQKAKWSSLAKNDPTAASMMELKQQQSKDPNNGTWQTGKYAGQKWSFEKAADLAMSDPSIFRNEYGNLSTFGDQWGKYTDAQKDAITKELLANNLYESKRGLIKVKDANKAKEIANSVLNGTNTSTTSSLTNKPTAGGSAFQSAIKNSIPTTRTSTRSPGIGLDGKPINYSIPRKK